MFFRPFAMHMLTRAADGPAGSAESADAPAAGAPASPPAEDVSLFADGPADPPPANGKPPRPEGVPQEFWDAEKGEVRLDALIKSRNDLRARLSRGEHKAPPAPDAYALPAVEGLPEGLIGGKDDTLLPAIRAKAHEVGLSQQQFQAIAEPFLAEIAKRLAEADAPPDAEAIEAARAAERAKLGANAQVVVAQVQGQLDGLRSRGVLTDGELAAIKRAGSAEGVMALSKLLALAGEKPIPLDHLAPGLVGQVELQKLMRDGYARKDVAQVERARAGLAALAQKGLLRDPRSPG